MEVRDMTFRGRAQAAAIQDMELTDCVFEACYVPRQTSPGAWFTIRNVSLNNASQVNCSINKAIVEDVRLHDLKRQGEAPLFLWGCVFRHVSLSGRISGLKINRSLSPIPGGGPPADQVASDEQARQFYAATDWALDISRAEFCGGVTFEALPGSKIKRDPDTQVLVSRSALLHSDWESFDYGNSAFNIALSWFLKGSLFDSVVLAARMGSKDAKKDLAVLAMLRQQGVAE